MSMVGRTASTAWAGDFWDGGSLTLPPTTGIYVRCVRGGTLASVFADHGNGTVTDKAKNLTWQQQDDGGKKTWKQALAYCEGLTLGGSSDWRLPNVKVLASIEDFRKYPVAYLTSFPTTKQGYSWSSTAVTTSVITGWQASFLGGSVGLPAEVLREHRVLLQVVPSRGGTAIPGVRRLEPPGVAPVTNTTAPPAPQTKMASPRTTLRAGSGPRHGGTHFFAGATSSGSCMAVSMAARCVRGHGGPVGRWLVASRYPLTSRTEPRMIKRIRDHLLPGP
jgi:hypothetical protein